MEVIADTGFIVALTNRSDQYHEIVKKIYHQQQDILVPQTVLAEVSYFIGKKVGIKVVSAWLKGLPQSKLTVLPLLETDILRTAEILEQYHDSRIDFVDASVMAMAERLNITKILTLDRRDFSIFRPKHCRTFILIP